MNNPSRRTLDWITTKRPWNSLFSSYQRVALNERNAKLRCIHNNKRGNRKRKRERKKNTFTEEKVKTRIRMNKKGYLQGKKIYIISVEKKGNSVWAQLASSPYIHSAGGFLMKLCEWMQQSRYKVVERHTAVSLLFRFCFLPFYVCVVFSVGNRKPVAFERTPGILRGSRVEEKGREKEKKRKRDARIK